MTTPVKLLILVNREDPLSISSIIIVTNINLPQNDMLNMLLHIVAILCPKIIIKLYAYDIMLASIILKINAYTHLLCSKLCWYNLPTPCRVGAGLRLSEWQYVVALWLIYGKSCHCGLIEFMRQLRNTLKLET
jgi:hypothetical protein